MHDQEFDPIIHIDDAPEESTDEGPPWAGSWRVLTPGMREAGGTLGVVMNRLPPGSAGTPFHWHLLEDEVFYVLSGRGLLRYGDSVRAIRPGDCISCPAGTQVAHQLANPASHDEDLVYLAIGPYLANEVAGYPDSGKIMVRPLRAVGVFDKRGYMDGEPEPPRILSMEPSS